MWNEDVRDECRQARLGFGEGTVVSVCGGQGGKRVQVRGKVALIFPVFRCENSRVKSQEPSKGQEILDAGKAGMEKLDAY